MSGRAHAAAAPGSVLVLDTETVDVPAGTAELVGHELVKVLSARSDVQPITMSDMTELHTLFADRRMLGCEADVACMAQLSQSAQAERVVWSSIGRVGKRWVLNLTLFDTRRADVFGRVSGALGSVQEIASALPALCDELFGWQQTPRPTFSLPGNKVTSLAVFSLAPTGVPPEVVKNLTQILSTQLKQIAGTSVISSDDVDAMLQLEEEKVRLGCVDDLSCIAEIGGALGVDKLVTGHVGQLARTYVVLLRMIDIRAARVDSSVTESFQGEAEQLIPAVRMAGRRLLGVSSDVPGSMVISTNALGALVHVNNEPYGVSPIPPLKELAPGIYNVRLSKGGFRDWRSDAYVEPAGATVLWAELQPTPTRWAFWGAVAAVGVTALTGVTFGALAEYNERRFWELVNAGTRPAARARAENRARDFSRTANTLYVSAGVLTVPVALIGLLTDWE